MEISGAVKPGALVETGYVHNQSVTFPLAPGLAHPRINGSRSGIFQRNVAKGAIVLISDGYRLGAVEDLERIGHIGGARHTGKIAADLGVKRHPVLGIFFLFRQSLRLVGQHAALDHGGAAWFGAQRAHLENRRLLRGVIQQVDVGSIDGLPNTVEVGMAIGKPGNTARGGGVGLRERRQSAANQQNADTKGLRVGWVGGGSREHHNRANPTTCRRSRGKRPTNKNRTAAFLFRW